MQESLLESLSAAVDGEAEELELRRVLNAVRDDDELRAKWARLHMIGAAVRASSMNNALPPSAREVAAAQHAPWLVAADAAPHALPRAGSRTSSKWLAPLTGIGVAAAAALTVVVLFGSGGDADGTVPPDAVAEAADPAPASIDPIAEREPATGLAQMPSAQDLRRANAYMVHHAQQTSLTTRPPGMPFVKVLSVSGRGDIDPSASTDGNR